MKLIKYRDMPDSTHTYFYVSNGEDGIERILSPFFNSQTEAEHWYNQQVELEKPNED